MWQLHETRSAVWRSTSNHFTANHFLFTQEFPISADASVHEVSDEFLRLISSRICLKCTDVWAKYDQILERASVFCCRKATLRRSSTVCHLSNILETRVVCFLAERVRRGQLLPLLHQYSKNKNWSVKITWNCFAGKLPNFFLAKTPWSPRQEIMRHTILHLGPRYCFF